MDSFQYKSTKPSEVGTGNGPIFIDPNEVAVLKLRIIPTTEGYFDTLNNQYVYNYTDHLGNVRLSYSDTNKDGIIQSRQYLVRECSGFGWNQMCIDIWKPGEIVETNNYYPFGLLHNYTATTQNAYQHKYNGKELQETGMLDYGWRQYMPEIGRWNGIDQLAEMYVSTSTYAYVANNPVLRFDVDGRWFNEDGTIDKSGRTPSFTTGKQMYNSFLGIKPSDGGGVGGGSLTVGNLMSALSPTFQFDKGAEKFYKENYPEFYDFIMSILPNIIEDSKFMSVLSDTSGFSIEELTKMFKSDTDFALMGFKDNAFSIADYPFGSNPQAPKNLIRMDIETLNWFKSANRDTKTMEGITNVVQMIGFVSHEINHWGVSAETNSSFRAKNLGGDPGDYFERKHINSRIQRIGDPGVPSGAFNSYIKQNYNTLYKIFNQ